MSSLNYHNMPKVDILMATYNGGAYIRAQLNSLISQSFTDWHLIIHDDGSTDNTVDIIRQYTIDPRIDLIEDNVVCGGAAKNFLYLTRFSNAPFCMFCDQDDIWFDNKVEMLYQAIENEQIDTPVAVYGRSYLWIPDKGIAGITGWSSFPYKLEQLICSNAGIQGCSAICNRAALQYLRNYNGRIAMHDHLLNIAVLTFGQAIPVATPLMLYRQHLGNVTGASPDSLSLWKRLWRSFCYAHPVIDRKHYDAIFDFYHNYKKDMTINIQKIFKAYLAMPNYSYIQKISTVIHYRLSRKNSIIHLVAKLLFHPYIN